MKRMNDLSTCGLVVIASLLVWTEMAPACTTGVVSGKATVDGRPLLWKNRDAPHKDNQVIHFSGGKYPFTAVVNAGQRTSIWMGTNEAGFCIENSVTNDLATKGAKGLGNGSFMRLALETCGTVEDFEELLNRTNGARATNANFGVIDAEGGAVIFETSASAFRKFDANDPEVAPHGYVVRSNFSFTGSGEPTDPVEVAKMYSGGRFLRGCKLMDMALADGGVSVSYLLQQSARDYADASGVAIPGSVNGEFEPLPPTLDTSHTISRRTSVSAAVFHGVAPGEDPRCTTMWTMLGEPAFTIAVPCWAATRLVADELVGAKTSPLCDTARALRDQVYVEQVSAEGEETLQLLDTSILPTVWERTLPTERKGLQWVAAARAEWRDQGFSVEEAIRLQERTALDAYTELNALAESLVVSTPQP